jgi:hypothetical protein
MSGFPGQRYALTRKTQELPKLLWQYQEEHAFDSDVVGCRLIIPAGFITDGASVPRIPIAYEYAGGGKFFEAAGFHDLLYTTEKYARATADAVLREAILAMGYDEHFALAVFEAVRMFGGSHWDLPNVPQPEDAHHALALFAPLSYKGTKA